MAASSLIRSFSSRIRPQQNRLAAALLFGHLRPPAFTTAAENNSRLSLSKESEDELKEKKSPKLHMFGREAFKEVDRRAFRVREILHPERYANGERLSKADQKFVIDEVLCYHPNSEDKIGCGVDYIMVDRHRHFASRCLFVVRVDGGSIDFSYRKCLRQSQSQARNC